jgi:DNA repair photolyase
VQREYKKGRGAQINTRNKFERKESTREHIEGIDEWLEAGVATQFIDVQAKSIVNKVDSPDVGMFYSMNPYMGCEHGCIYCYARNSFEYWGYSAGLDFESKILVKQNAPELLRKFLVHPKWKCVPISISGNTDCYQPAEQKFRLTRKLLEVCNEFNQPVGIITKNAAILRDKDLLQEMASRRLVSVIISLTTFNKELRRAMEPRTTTALQRLRVIEELSKVGVQMGLMLGPIIPGLNEHEMPAVIKAAAEAGATFSAYTFVRLNGAVKVLFHDWLYQNFPDRADKVWHLVESGHGGKVSDSRWGVRMRGEGNIAKLVADQYHVYTKKYGLAHQKMGLDCTRFSIPVSKAGRKGPKGEGWGQTSLF